MNQSNEVQQSIKGPPYLIRHNGELHQINDTQSSFETTLLLFVGEVYKTSHLAVENKEMLVEGRPFLPKEKFNLTYSRLHTYESLALFAAERLNR
jgi:hypothetical protein